MLLYKISTLSPRIDVYLKPLVWASNTPISRFCTIFGRMYRSLSFGFPLPIQNKNISLIQLRDVRHGESDQYTLLRLNNMVPVPMINVSCCTKSAFSFSSASRVLNVF